MNTQQQYFLTQRHKWTSNYELEPIAGKTWDWVGRCCPSMNTDFSDKERKRTNQKQRNYMARLLHPKTTKKYTQSQTTITKNWEVSRTWHVICMHMWPYVTLLRPKAHFTTKISKLSRFPCVQHLLCWTHSTCSLCTAHVLLILFITSFRNYLTTCLTVIFTYVVLVQTPNSQNIHNGELWTCDNNEITHPLRSK